MNIVKWWRGESGWRVFISNTACLATENYMDFIFAIRRTILPIFFLLFFN